MKCDNTTLQIQRVEVIRRVFNGQNQVVQEQIEYYYPEELKPEVIGFKDKPRKKSL